jgi:hypothetical protein
MRARSLSRVAQTRCRVGPAWHEIRRSARTRRFLPGPDADARLRELAASLTAARPLLGALAVELVDRRLYEALGYRSLGDYGRERLGVGARVVREWARVWRRLEALPVLRRAVLAGELGWTAARLVAGLATPETEQACLATVRGRTVRAVEAIVRAFRESEGLAADEGEGDEDGFEDAGRVKVRLACTDREATLWAAAVELARRVAGESLPLWRCAEAVAAEAASAWGASDASGASEPEPGAAQASEEAPEPEHGLRRRAFPGFAWTGPARSALPGPIAALAHRAADRPAREIDRRLRAVIAFLQTVDLEMGVVLRQMQDRGLFAELGFAGLERYAVERLDVSSATARRLVALGRVAHRAPLVGRAFRDGRLHAFQAHVVARVVAGDGADARVWIERARRVTLRRLEAEVEAVPRPTIEFRAPPEVARLFLGMLQRAGSLERLLAHAIATWSEHGAQFEDYADFERDGFRCAVPGCTRRRNLHSHHLHRRGRGGPDLPSNRITLCAQHHERSVHGSGSVRIRGFAPDGLVFELGPAPAERYRSGDVRLSPPSPSRSRRSPARSRRSRRRRAGSRRSSRA